MEASLVVERLRDTLLAYKRLLDAGDGTRLDEALRIERAASLAKNAPVGGSRIDARLVRLRGRKA